jgi:hypothetical protein
MAILPRYLCIPVGYYEYENAQFYDFGDRNKVTLSPNESYALKIDLTRLTENEYESATIRGVSSDGYRYARYGVALRPELVLKFTEQLRASSYYYEREGKKPVVLQERLVTALTENSDYKGIASDLAQRYTKAFNAYVKSYDGAVAKNSQELPKEPPPVPAPPVRKPEDDFTEAPRRLLEITCAPPVRGASAAAAEVGGLDVQEARPLVMDAYEFADRSPVVAKMLTGPFKEASDERIPLTFAASRETAIKLLQFIKRNLPIQVNGAQEGYDLYNLAERFDLPYVRDVCRPHYTRIALEEMCHPRLLEQPEALSARLSSITPENMIAIHMQAVAKVDQLNKDYLRHCI